ncbi:MAG: SDR family NAD(P)-dependent oxidoreductase [Deltaproteobacteria bacterium]|jgi:NAD(P)-dependent dehydrogenase (short-subunit alcohol dehydrogenase family)|nr:SDR family NAD(P)-dependent oxidoreductase [Deltaproteobacteria bacterium]
MSERLKDKVAVITGGAGGLGLSVALTFAKEGAAIVLLGRNAERLATAQTSVEAAGAKCLSLVANAAEPESIAKALADAEEKMGGLDILVNSAGVFIWKGFLDLEPAQWQTTLDSNLSAAFFATQAFARLAVAAKRQGAVINVSSIHGSVGDGGVVPHCASKFGLIGLTEASAEALRGSGVRVNCLSPGAIEPDSADRTSESLKSQVTQGELAKMCVFLGSDESGNLTGTNLNAFGVTRPVIAPNK